MMSFLSQPRRAKRAKRDGSHLRPVSLWHNRDFVLLWGGQGVSALGSAISNIGLALLVLTITHSASQVAFLASVEALPFLLLTLPAGALIDRWDRKWVMRWCDVGRALCLLSIAVALAAGQLRLPQLYLVALCEGSLATLYNLAGLAGIQRVVATSQLGQASSATYISSNTAGLVGPPLGSWLYAAASAAPFLADALSYLVSVVTLGWVHAPFQAQVQTSRTASISTPPTIPTMQSALCEFMRSMYSGLAWMWNQSVLRFQALAGCVVSFALYPTTALVVALAAHLGVPQASIGVIFSLGAVGGLAGGIVAPWLQRRVAFGRIMGLHFGLLAVGYAAYLAAPNLIWLGILLAATTLVEAVGSITNIAYRLAQTPDTYQGRVNSIHRFVGFGVGRPLGAVLLGLLLAHYGLTVSVLAFASVLGLFALATMVYAPLQAVKRLE
jgi:MFS family permease